MIPQGRTETRVWLISSLILFYGLPRWLIASMNLAAPIDWSLIYRSMSLSASITALPAPPPPPLPATLLPSVHSLCSAWQQSVCLTPPPPTPPLLSVIIPGEAALTQHGAPVGNRSFLQPWWVGGFACVWLFPWFMLFVRSSQSSCELNLESSRWVIWVLNTVFILTIIWATAVWHVQNLAQGPTHGTWTGFNLANQQIRNYILKIWVFFPPAKFVVITFRLLWGIFF